MSDDWEDWEEESFAPPALKSGSAANDKTKGDLLLAKEKEVDTSKFAGEDEGEEEEPAWKKLTPVSQERKQPVAKKAYEDRGKVDQGQPLEDPAKEKLRIESLQQQSDLNAFKDLLGTEDVDLNTFEPKTAKDFDSLARTLVNKYIQPYEKDSKFKGLLKAFMKNALADSDVQQVKDLETCLAGIRADKLKEEKAAAAAKKAAGKKKILNVGRSGGSAGLDDFQYDVADDDDDFM